MNEHSHYYPYKDNNVPTLYDLCVTCFILYTCVFSVNKYTKHIHTKRDWLRRFIYWVNPVYGIYRAIYAAIF